MKPTGCTYPRPRLDEETLSTLRMIEREGRRLRMLARLRSFAAAHDLALAEIRDGVLIVSAHCSAIGDDGTAYACSTIPEQVNTFGDLRNWLGY